MHPTETEAYWRALAKTARAFARAERSSRHGTVESIQIHEANAADYDAQADRIAREQETK